MIQSTKILSCLHCLLLLMFFIPDLSGQPLSVPPKRGHHALVYDEQSKSVLMTNGSTPVNGGQSFTFYNDIWIFDGTSWKSEGIAGDERSSVAFAYDSKKRNIMSMYGFSKENKPISELRKYENGKWSIVSICPELKVAEGGFVYDRRRDNFIAFGGSRDDHSLNGDTWVWDRKEWRKLAVESPPARQAFAMVYDSIRGRTIVFGGMGPTPETLFDDTWEFDGTTWKKVSDKGPGARMALGYVYNSKSGQLIIFGGAGKDGIEGDTWAWDGKEWRLLSSSGPKNRMMGYMAYDQKRNKVVMFGGRLGWPNDANDTWEWDGSDWKEVK